MMRRNRDCRKHFSIAIPAWQYCILLLLLRFDSATMTIVKTVAGIPIFSEHHHTFAVSPRQLAENDTNNATYSATSSYTSTMNKTFVFNNTIAVDTSKWNPKQKDFKICSVANGLDLTRLRSFIIRAIFRDTIDDVELMREYISEAMYNGGIKGSFQTLEDMAKTLNWKARNLTEGETTMDAGLGWADDSPDRRMERWATTPDVPFVGTKDNDLRLLNTLSNILPWIHDRKSKEKDWLVSHQNGRTEGPEKEALPYNSLYSATWAASYGGVLIYFPPVNKILPNATFGDLLGGNYSLHNSSAYPKGWPFNHTKPEYIKDAIFGLPYADVAHPGLSLISALAPVYYNGTFDGYNYQDTFIATVSIDMSLDAISVVLSEFEDSLAQGSFAMLADTSTFDVVSISQYVVNKVYPRFTGNESERYVPNIMDRRNKPYLVADTIYQSLVDGLTSADWSGLQKAVLKTPRGERGYKVMNITSTNDPNQEPVTYYAMFDRWSSVADWVTMVFAPVKNVDYALNPVLKDKDLVRNATYGDIIRDSTTLRNEGTLDFLVTLSDNTPDWVELDLDESFRTRIDGGGGGIVVKPNEELVIKFSVHTRRMRNGTTTGLIQFFVEDNNYPDCVYSNPIAVTLSLTVFPKPKLNQLGRIRRPGLALSGVLMLSAVICVLWIFKKRDHRVLRSSQPFFLVMLCIGVFIMATTIIPLSIDDAVCNKMSGCDKACMASPWLFSIGFVISFSALFSKIWRVNRIFHQQGFRRIVVKKEDALIPFLILFVSNFIFLLAWTLTDPLVWKRKKLGTYDSYGICAPREGGKAVIFVSIIAAIDFTALILACYEAYRARFISDEFSETKYIGMAVMSMLQVSTIGVPVMFLVTENPTASFFVRLGLIFIIGMSILLLIFVPKMLFVKNYTVVQRQRTETHLSTIIKKANEGGQRYSNNSDLKSSVFDEDGNASGRASDDLPDKKPQTISSARSKIALLESILQKHGIDYQEEIKNFEDHSTQDTRETDQISYSGKDGQKHPSDIETPSEGLNVIHDNSSNHDSTPKADTNTEPSKKTPRVWFGRDSSQSKGSNATNKR